MVPASYPDHLREVYGHYEASDFDLALRRLLDCVIETGDPQLFRNALQYCDWLEQSGEQAGAAEVRARALQLLDQLTRVSVAPSADYRSTILSTEEMAKQYSKGPFRLSAVSMTLNTGEIIGLVGENGNGKTTLLRLLAKELQPDNGRIEYRFNPAPADDYALRTKLAYIEQRIPRWYGSLMDNLQFTIAHYGTRAGDNYLWAEIIIARLGLRPYRQHTWNRLSSGYRTRFEIARNLLRRPRILLLDEPLANLDVLSQQTILQDLKFMSRSLTAPFGMVLSSQHIYEVEKVSDRIIFLKNGTPQYQQQTAETTEAPPGELIFELETEVSRETLVSVLAALQPSRIHFNGGVYLLHFSGQTDPSAVLQTLAQAAVPVVYLRNISRSSRRFFIR